jgi:hypothetical protein
MKEALYASFHPLPLDLIEAHREPFSLKIIKKHFKKKTTKTAAEKNQ